MVLAALEQPKLEGPHLQLLEKPTPVLASGMQRSGAYLVDIILVSVFSAITSNLLLYAYQTFAASQALPPLSNRSPLEVDLFKQSISLIIFTSYFTLSYWYTNGKTVGKMWLGLQVILDSNQNFTLPLAFKRALAYQVSYIILGIGFALAFIREDKKCLHDLICKTKVIKI